MMLKRSVLRLALCAIPILLTCTAVRADFITGYGWVTTEPLVNSSTGASAATLADPTCSHGTAACMTSNADVTFTTTGVSFSATGANIATWLASSAFPLNGLVDTAGSSLMDPTIWEFVGNISVTSPDVFTFTHDDGMTFVVNGQTVVDQPGPTAPTVSTGTYTGAAGGSVAFDLIYSECCGGPAVLETSLLGPSSAPVPEPASIALFGGALLLLGAAGRKLRKAA